MEAAGHFQIPDLPAVDDRLAWWELMQHHGAPTRLLDWTRSPFIALWFAFWHQHEEGGDAALWVFDSRNSWINQGPSTLRELRYPRVAGFSRPPKLAESSRREGDRGEGLMPSHRHSLSGAREGSGSTERHDYDPQRPNAFGVWS
jgi:hypothetical protein